MSDRLSVAEKQYAAEVKRLREERGWTQTELVERLLERDIPYANLSMVSRIENATRPVRMIEAQALSQVFDRAVELMLHPDSSVKLLLTSQSVLKNGWSKFNALLDVAKVAAKAQRRAADNLVGIQSWFSRHDELSPGVREMYERLEKSLDHFAHLDLLASVAERMEHAIEDAETLESRNLERRRATRDKWIASRGAEETDWFAVGEYLRGGWQPPAGEKWNFVFNAEDAEFRAIVMAFTDHEAVTRGIHQETR